MSDYLQRLVERHLGNTAPVMPNANSYISVGTELAASPAPADFGEAGESESTEATRSGEQPQGSAAQRPGNESGMAGPATDHGVGAASARTASTSIAKPNQEQDYVVVFKPFIEHTPPPPHVTPMGQRSKPTPSVVPAASGRAAQVAARVSAVTPSTPNASGDSMQPAAGEPVNPTAVPPGAGSPPPWQPERARSRLASSQPTRAARPTYPVAHASTSSSIVNGVPPNLRPDSADHSARLEPSQSTVAIAAKADFSPRASGQISETAMAGDAPARTSTIGYATSAAPTSVHETHADMTMNAPTVTAPVWHAAIRPAANATMLPLPAAAATPSISISIGSIEVRAAASMPEPAAPPPRAGPRLSLDDYLRNRNGGGT